MLKRWVMWAVFGAAVSGSFSCGQCAIYCANLQKLIFRDAFGAPLRPLKVTDGQTVHLCNEGDAGTPSVFVTCTEDSLTYDMRTFAAHSIRAEAATGQVFEGTITPENIVSPRPVGSCGCGGNTLTPITLQLSGP